MNTKKNAMFYILFSLIIILAIVLLFNVRAYGKDKGDLRSLDAKESLLKAELSDYLKSEGLKNCGITVTKSCYGDDSIDTIIRIHLPSYTNLNENEKEALRENLLEITEDMEFFTAEVSFS